MVGLGLTRVNQSECKRSRSAQVMLVQIQLKVA